MITARADATNDLLPYAALYDGETLILKAYANREGTKIRIVLPELRTMRQTKIDDKRHWLEFDRVPEPIRHRLTDCRL